MAFDTFLYFEGQSNGAPPIAGETTDRVLQEKKAIELTSYKFDVENPTSIGSAGGGAGTGKARLNPLVFTKAVDATTAALFKACAVGGHYAKATLLVRRANAGPTAEPLIRIELRLVFVTSLQQVLEDAKDTLQDEVKLAYGAVTISAGAGSAAGGTRPPVVHSWNQVTNSENPEVSSPN